MKQPIPFHRTLSPTQNALQVGSDLLFSEGGITLFFILPAVIALFLIEAMPQF
jgi:hypothetical protein